MAKVTMVFEDVGDGVTTCITVAPTPTEQSEVTLAMQLVRAIDEQLKEWAYGEPEQGQDEFVTE